MASLTAADVAALRALPEAKALRHAAHRYHTAGGAGQADAEYDLYSAAIMLATALVEKGLFRGAPPGPTDGPK